MDRGRRRAARGARGRVSRHSKSLEAVRTAQPFAEHEVVRAPTARIRAGAAVVAAFVARLAWTPGVGTAIRLGAHPITRDASRRGGPESTPPGESPLDLIDAMGRRRGGGTRPRGGSPRAGELGVGGTTRLLGGFWLFPPRRRAGRRSAAALRRRAFVWGGLEGMFHVTIAHGVSPSRTTTPTTLHTMTRRRRAAARTLASSSSSSSTRRCYLDPSPTRRARFRERAGGPPARTMRAGSRRRPRAPRLARRGGPSVHLYSAIGSVGVGTGKVVASMVAPLSR